MIPSLIPQQAALDLWTNFWGLVLKQRISIRHMPLQYRENRQLPNKQNRFNRWKKICFMPDKDFQWWFGKKEKLAQFFQMISLLLKMIMKPTKLYCRHQKHQNIKRLIFRLLINRHPLLVGSRLLVQMHTMVSISKKSSTRPQLN